MSGIPEWDDLVVAGAFFLLLLSGLPLRRVRQAMLSFAQAGLQIGLLAAVVGLAAMAFAPRLEPAWISHDLQPAAEWLAVRVGVPAAEVKPVVLWTAAACMVPVGLVLIQVLSFARRLGAHDALLRKLYRRLCQVADGGGPESSGSSGGHSGAIDEFESSARVMSSLTRSSKKTAGAKKRLADLLRSTEGAPDGGAGTAEYRRICIRRGSGAAQAAEPASGGACLQLSLDPLETKTCGALRSSAR